MPRKEFHKDSEYKGFQLHTSNDFPPKFKIKILDELIDHLHAYTWKHNKVLFLRYDLTFPIGFNIPPDNNYLSTFLNKLRVNLSYKGYDPVSLWRRELGPFGGRAHYHCILLCDASQVQTIKGLLYEITRLWHHVLEYAFVTNEGLVDYCEKKYPHQMDNGIVIKRPSSVETDPVKIGEQVLDYQQKLNYCIKWGSYLAKVDNRAETEYDVRSFNSSPICYDAVLNKQIS